MLSQAEIDSFVANGYVAVRDALPADVMQACHDEIWSELGDRGVRREDPSTWRDPVVRINCPESEAFAAAGTQPVLWEAFDQLIGEGRWWRRRGVGGTIPVRFPSQDDPGDAGWHIEASFERNGDWWVNYRSRQRGLLALYLFSDVDADGAPTRVRPGSHRDAARVLAPAGDEGVPFPQAALLAAQASADRPTALATGRAGGRHPLPPVPGPRRVVAARGPAAEDHGPARRCPARRVPAGAPAEPSRARHDR
jgi:hypothetical protein